MSNHRVYRILTIDDNPAIHVDFAKIFAAITPSVCELRQLESSIFGDTSQFERSQSFVLDSALQGRDGCAKIKAAIDVGEPFAVAFVDVRMPPDWDGIETVENIWKVDPHIQIVLCTAYSDYSWEDVRRRLGTSDSLLVLKKPFENIEVIQLAHALSCKWELARRARGVADGSRQTYSA